MNVHIGSFWVTCTGKRHGAIFLGAGFGSGWPCYAKERPEERPLINAGTERLKQKMSNQEVSVGLIASDIGSGKGSQSLSSLTFHTRRPILWPSV